MLGLDVGMKASNEVTNYNNDLIVRGSAEAPSLMLTVEIWEIGMNGTGVSLEIANTYDKTKNISEFFKKNWMIVKVPWRSEASQYTFGHKRRNKNLN